MACALLVSSALLVRTVRHMMDTPMGVQADSVLITTVQLTLPAAPRGTPVRDQLAADRRDPRAASSRRSVGSRA